MFLSFSKAVERTSRCWLLYRELSVVLKQASPPHTPLLILPCIHLHRLPSPTELGGVFSVAPSLLHASARKHGHLCKWTPHWFVPIWIHITLKFAALMYIICNTSLYSAQRMKCSIHHCAIIITGALCCNLTRSLNPFAWHLVWIHHYRTCLGLVIIVQYINTFHFRTVLQIKMQS